MMLDQRIARALCYGLRPEAICTVSEWADRARVLPAETSAEPGQWRTSRTPYLREIMDCLSAHVDVSEVCLMAASQVGKSECANNFIGYAIESCPSPTMIVQPTIEVAEAYGRLRIQPMIDACPTLRRLVTDQKSRNAANTLQTKTFPGGLLRIVGANAPSGLASLPIRFLLLDEVDRYPREAGTEGDPIALARQRTATFASRKVFMCSSPGMRGESKIEARYLQGDQRRYHVACPHCDARQVLRWGERDSMGGVVWPEGQPEAAAYQCEACGTLIDESAKLAMLDGGEWVASATAKEPGLRSYHLSALYSPWTTWAQLAVEWTSAQGDPVKLKVFFNTKLAETWDGEWGEQLDPESLLARRERYAQEVPAGVHVVTAGVDVQGDRIEVGVWGWGSGEEAWALSHAVLPGDPAMPEVWQELDALLSRPWVRDGIPLRIAATAIDSGHQTQAVYQFCTARSGRNVWAIKGMTGKGELWPAKPRPTKRGNGKLYIVRHDAAKQAMYSRLRRSGSGPGSIHIPQASWATDAWCRQMTTERRLSHTNKRTGAKTVQWVKAEGSRNEAWDCLIYAYAALHGWQRKGHRLAAAPVSVQTDGDRAVDQPRPAPAAQPTPQPKPQPPAPPKRAGEKRRSSFWR